MNISLEDDPNLISHDSYIDMKCTFCGYEEKMPNFVYGEEADFLIDIGDPEPPCFQCHKCHHDTLYRKDLNTSSK